MPITSENPMGTEGFSFLEFASDEVAKLEQIFTQLGFSCVYRDEAKQRIHYSQQRIHFIINTHPDSHANGFSQIHHTGVCGMAFRVTDPDYAYQHALKMGAKPFTPSHLPFPAIEGIGGTALYFVNKTSEALAFPFLETMEANQSLGLIQIDHLTHNVKRGQMAVWKDFYERLFGFKPIRYFNIQGQHTGLISYALASPCGQIKIPLNESTDDHSQIEEFIATFNGEGIQHVAFKTEDIYQSVEDIGKQGIHFMQVPDTYFEMIATRIPAHEENLARMKKNKILIDGDMTAGIHNILLQIFTEPLFGPVFFEIIQRKGNQGFGEGNFQALFESIERDQIQRGVLSTQGKS